MTKQQRLVLIVSILASSVAFLDGAIVNVALPAISHDLGGGLSAQQWMIDAYLLTLGSFILIAGSLSDLVGRKRILSLGLLGFGITSVLCAAAPNSAALVIFRALQGIAGALLVPSSLALIISKFSGPAEGKAVGTWTAFTPASFIIGPLLGGILVDTASWRWIFAVNVLPIAVTMYLLRLVEADTPTKGARIDLVGTVLCALGLGGPVFALIEQPHYGWSSPLIYVPLLAGLAVLGGFLVFEARAKTPMLPLSLFRNRNFSVGNVATTAVYAGLSVATFLIVVFLQQVNGYSALAAGVAMLPVTLLMFLLSSRFGGLSAKYGPRLFMGVGPVIAGLGFLLMLRMTSHVDYWTQLFPGVVVFGLGLSVTVAPLTAAILGDVPKPQAGIASAVNNAIARIAGLVAIAAVGAVVASNFGSSLDNRASKTVPARAIAIAKQSSLTTTPPAPYQHDRIFKQVLVDASVSAYHLGILVTAGLIIAGGVISLVGIKNPKKDMTDPLKLGTRQHSL